MIKEKKIFKSQFRESRNKQNKLNFLNKKKLLNQIKNKKIYDLEVKRTIKISQLFKRNILFVYTILFFLILFFLLKKKYLIKKLLFFIIQMLN